MNIYICAAARLCPTDIYSLKIVGHNDPMIAARPNEKKKTRSATIRAGSVASAGPHTGHDTEDSGGSGRPLPGQTWTGRHDRLPAKGHDRRLHPHGSRGAHLPQDGGSPQDEPEPRHEDRAAQDTLKVHHMARLRHDPRAVPAGGPHEDHRRCHGDRLTHICASNRFSADFLHQRWGGERRGMASLRDAATASQWGTAFRLA